MGGFIGTIALRDPLNWVTEKKYLNLGTEIRALDGTVVQSWMQQQSPDEEHTFKFTWVTSAQLEQIKVLIKSRTPFEVRCTTTSDTIGPCRFKLQDPISYEPVVTRQFWNPESAKNTRTDLYNGEIHVWISPNV